MKHLVTSTLPAMIFCGAVVLVYYLYFRLWVTWGIRQVRKKESKGVLSCPAAISLHIVAVFGALCLAYGYFVEPYRPQVNVVSIETDKLRATTFRVVQISDLHCDTTIRLENRLPEIINNLSADVVVFTGDAINREDALGLFQQTLNQLDAPLGKFAVTGNWDDAYWSTSDLFGGTGFVELDTQKQAVEKNGESIVISGVAYINGPNAARVVDTLREQDYNVLLYHTTALIDFLDDTPVNLYLSGHTHGGQVALPFYGALTTLSEHGKTYESGLYEKGPIQLYVNRGIGLEGGHAPRVRFWARPEITVFDIGPEVEKSEK